MLHSGQCSSLSVCTLQLYSSIDFGRKWQLVHDDVMPGRFYWYGFMDLFIRLLIVIYILIMCDPMLSEGFSDLLSNTADPSTHGS